METDTPGDFVGSLYSEDDGYVDRHPGVAEIERLFPSPVAMGKGSLALEGGVSVVAGPGMGKTTLFRQLASKLQRTRGLTTGIVTLPSVSSYSDESGFYAFLGALVQSIRAALSEATQQPIVEVLSEEPAWDAPPGHLMTPRGFERFITRLAQAAVHTPGICLLFDDVDEVNVAAWKGPFISALRFVFQTSSGITPIYALWKVFADESLPGSNYFRNVTRPIFLEPLDLMSRITLADKQLPALSLAAKQAVARMAGGHPLLLQRILSQLSAGLPDPLQQAALLPANIKVALGDAFVDEQRQLVRELLSGSGALATALSDLHRKRLTYATLPRGLVASGFVDSDDAGVATLAERVADVIA